MRAAIIRSIFLIALLGGFFQACAQFQMRFDPETRTWTIDNGRARAVFQLTPAGIFSLLGFEDLKTGDAWTPPAGTHVSPIRLKVDGAWVDRQTAFNLVRRGARSWTRRSYRELIELEVAGKLGRVILELEMYENQPVLRYRVRYQNLLPKTIWVTDADMASWAFDDGGKTFRTFYVNQWVKGGKQGNFEPIEGWLSRGGPPARMTTGAYGQHCTWLALRDDSDRGLFAGWEFDGRASASAVIDEEGLQLTASVQELNRALAANQQFIVPASFIGLFHGDWDEAGFRTQRFAEAALAREMPDQGFPYVMWDSWKYQVYLHENTLMRDAEIAASIGVEVFVVDLGWSRQIGDWYEDPAKFPSGLRTLSGYVHSLGMKFGLHIPLAEAARASPALQANPDWTSSESYGYFGAESLCLSHRPVRQWITSELTRIIDQYGVDWILQDGENMVKRCTKTSHTHDPQDSNYSNAVDGLNAVVTSVSAARPAVHWENCEDGGNMMTYNMVRNYVTSIAADDSGPMTTRQAVYGITYPFPPRYADRYMPDEQLDRYITRSFMFGGPWILMNRLEQMREEHIELLCREIALYKSFRTRVRDGKVFHLTARPDENRIDAMQSYHEESDTAILFVFRPEATANFYRARPRGLKPDTLYRIRFQEDVRRLTRSGKDLMAVGIRVDFPGMWSPEIVYIEPVAP